MGRALKGQDRAQIAAKPNGPLAEVIKANAKALGMSHGDYIVAIAAYALGMPEHAPHPESTLDTLDGLNLDGVLLPSTVAVATPAPVTDIRSSARPKREPRQQIAS
ncbi:hypothetical protein [Microbacterium sp. W4I20]|uniref:hypothetical protein n=1 Tax=Microbacterium sp. W4I20 TaxID=3042262 RepID=UPI00277DA6C4|nr:hypothetical protein [Microbacterium sp. W4I20]MDQ0729099.1 hypothetical protein [Microbacterium sp. W4I20]